MTCLHCLGALDDLYPTETVMSVGMAEERGLTVGLTPSQESVDPRESGKRWPMMCVPDKDFRPDGSIAPIALTLW